MLRIISTFAAILATISLGATAGVNTWTTLNTGVGMGSLVAVHPTDANIIFVARSDEVPPFPPEVHHRLLRHGLVPQIDVGRRVRL